MSLQLCTQLTAADERLMRRCIDGFLPARIFDIHAHLFHTRHFAPYREFFRSLFEPAPALRPTLEEADARLRSRGKTVVGIHVRRGDFLQLPYSPFAFVVPTRWWRQWLESFWSTLEEPVLFIASDDPAPIAAELADFHPVTARDLGVQFPHYVKEGGLFLDHFLLSRCDAVGISNSSFGFTACMLNRRATRFARATTEPPYLVPFDPWNDKPILMFGDGSGKMKFKEVWKRCIETQSPLEMIKSLGFYGPSEWVKVSLYRWLIAFHCEGFHGPVMSILHDALGARYARFNLTREDPRWS